MMRVSSGSDLFWTCWNRGSGIQRLVPAPIGTACAAMKHARACWVRMVVRGKDMPTIRWMVGYRWSIKRLRGRRRRQQASCKVFVDQVSRKGVCTSLECSSIHCIPCQACYSSMLARCSPWRRSISMYSSSPHAQLLQWHSRRRQPSPTVPLLGQT